MSRTQIQSNKSKKSSEHLPSTIYLPTIYVLIVKIEHLLYYNCHVLCQWHSKDCLVDLFVLHAHTVTANCDNN